MILDDHHYLFQLRAACVAQPHLNAHQLGALDHVVAIASSSGSIEQFLEATSDLLEIARGASLDRAWNLRESALMHDDPWLAQSAAMEYRHALLGGSHAEFYVAVQQGQAEGARFRERSGQVSSCIKRLLHCLVLLRSSSTASVEYELEVRYCVAELVSMDPVFRPRGWLDHKRYRWRVPWSTDALHLWLEEFWPEDVPVGLELPDTGIEQDRERWLACLGRFDGRWPQPPPLKIPVCQGIYEALLDRQQVWPNSWLARHALEASAAIAGATTSIARESISVDRALKFDMDATWNQVLLSSLLAPLRAAAMESLTGVEELSLAIEASQALTGLCAHDLLRLPAVQAFLKNNLEPHLETGLEGLSAFDGEAGFDLLQAAVVLKQASRTFDFESMISDQAATSVDWPILYRGAALSLKGYGVES